MRGARRGLAWAFAAFTFGAAVSAVALYDGSTAQDAVAALVGAGDHAAVIVVVNNGTHALNASIEITRQGGGTHRIALAWTAPPGRVSQREVVGLASAEYAAWGRFSWSEPPRQARGDRIILFDPAECDAGERAVVTFLVESTNGITIPGPDDVKCA